MLPVKSALFINHCVYRYISLVTTREAFTAASTAKILYQHTERIPEHPDNVEMKVVLKNIAVKNASMLLPGDMRPSWNLEFVPIDETCVLCGTPLGQLQHIPGSNAKAYLLTKVKLLPAKAYMKKCPNQHCLARHSYRTWREGMYFKTYCVVDEYPYL